MWEYVGCILLENHHHLSPIRSGKPREWSTHHRCSGSVSLLSVFLFYAISWRLLVSDFTNPRSDSLIF